MSSSLELELKKLKNKASNLKKDRLASRIPSNIQNNYVLRDMTEEDFKEITQWAINEHWNPIIGQHKPFFAQDTSCYQVLELQGKVIAAILIIKYSTDFGFLGHFIVKKEFRHQGYGRLLLDHTLRKCRDVKSIGLNGVIDQIDYYIKNGFKPTFNSSRWQGIFANVKDSDSLSSTINKVSITDQNPLTHILQYEKKNFPYNREQFITEWQKMPESYVLAALIDEQVVGYCVATPCHEGIKIAPLYANNAEIAIKLCKELALKYKNQVFNIDIPEINSNTQLLVKSFGLEKVFDTQRMYTNGEPTPSINYDKIFGYMTFEFGI